MKWLDLFGETISQLLEKHLTFNLSKAVRKYCIRLPPIVMADYIFQILFTENTFPICLVLLYK